MYFSANLNSLPPSYTVSIMAASEQDLLSETMTGSQSSQTLLLIKAWEDQMDLMLLKRIFLGSLRLNCPTRIYTDVFLLILCYSYTSANILIIVHRKCLSNERQRTLSICEVNPRRNGLSYRIPKIDAQPYQPATNSPCRRKCWLERYTNRVVSKYFHNSFFFFFLKLVSGLTFHWIKPFANAAGAAQRGKQRRATRNKCEITRWGIRFRVFAEKGRRRGRLLRGKRKINEAIEDLIQ